MDKDREQAPSSAGERAARAAARASGKPTPHAPQQAEGWHAPDDCPICRVTRGGYGDARDVKTRRQGRERSGGGKRRGAGLTVMEASQIERRRADAAMAQQTKAPPGPRGARDKGGAAGAQARSAEHPPGVGIYRLPWILCVIIIPGCAAISGLDQFELGAPEAPGEAPGTAGLGGPGGDADLAMDEGSDGVVAAEQEFP